MTNKITRVVQKKSHQPALGTAAAAENLAYSSRLNLCPFSRAYRHTDVEVV